MNNNDSIYIRLGKRFQRVPADMRGMYLSLMGGELFLSRERPDGYGPIGVVVGQIGTTLVLAEYETSGPMNFKEAMRPKELTFGYIKPHCELPSRRELLQMYEQKDKFPEFDEWLWSKEQYAHTYWWIMSWSSGYMTGNHCSTGSNYVRRVFHISIKSLFV